MDSDRRVIEELRLLRPTGRAWAASEDGQRVMEAIRVNDRSPEGVHALRPRYLASGLATCSAVLIVALIIGAFVFATSDRPRGGLATATDTFGSRSPQDTRPSSQSAGQQGSSPPLSGDLDSGRPPGYVFDSLPQLVANADLVVRGRVLGEEPGRAFADGSGTVYRLLETSVTTVFKGQVSMDDSLLIRQGVYIDGRAVSTSEEQPIFRAGDDLVVFLVPSAQSPGSARLYTIVAVPGIWLVDEGFVRTAAIDPVATSLTGRRWADVKQELIEAVQQASRTGMAPLPGGP